MEKIKKAIEKIISDCPRLAKIIKANEIELRLFKIKIHIQEIESRRRDKTSVGVLSMITYHTEI